MAHLVKFWENPMDDYLQYVGGTFGLAAITGAAAATALYMAYSPTPMYPNIDINSQSLEVPNTGGARQSRLAPPGEMTGFIYDDAKTLLEMMQRGCRLSGNGPCLGTRGSKPEYSFLTYSEVIEKAKNLGSGFVHIGMKPGQSSFIGIYAQNCAEWIITEHACYNQSAVIVPLYDTLGANACIFIMNQSEMKIVVCDTEEKVKLLLKQKDQTPLLKHIIVVKEVSDEVKQAAKNKGVELSYFKDIEALGKEKPIDVFAPQPSDIATVCYTSGTTGDPKGVMLTHANIITDACAIVLQLGEHTPNKDDTMMSFLPLAHMLERLCEVTLYLNGGSVGFFRGDIRLLMDDMKALKPTVTPAVPRLLNRIYDKGYKMHQISMLGASSTKSGFLVRSITIIEQVTAEKSCSLHCQSGHNGNFSCLWLTCASVQSKINGSKIKRFLFDLALSMKESELHRFIIRNNSIWDRLVFKPVREGMGGRVRLLVCGSAPLAGNVLTFIRCALGCLVIEGYGQTECVAPCTFNIVGDYSVAQVGPPISCCWIKLVDVPEMEYFASNNQGEVCIKGLNVFKGYFKDPEKTKETIDADGWLHTGDIGEWLPNGALKIVDRKKHIFKLAQGEYIAPEKIENIYIASPYVSQIFVHGESLQSCLVAIIVPDKENLLVWCREKGISGSWNEICKNKAVKNLILDDITSLGKKEGLKSFEQVKDIYLHPEMFSVENGLLTPTMKTKRPDCRKCFMDVIQSMYRLMV